MLNVPEAQRLATVITMSQAMTKVYIQMSEGTPDIIFQMMLEQDVKALNTGDVILLSMELLNLYKKCVDAGILDQSAVDGFLMERFRRTIERMPDELKSKAHTPAEAVQEIYANIQHIQRTFDKNRGDVAGLAEAVVKKARG